MTEHLVCRPPVIDGHDPVGVVTLAGVPQSQPDPRTGHPRALSAD